MTTHDRLESFRSRYAKVRSGWEPATALYERCVASALTQDSRVLDLGCGRGGIVERQGGTGTWIGLDPDMSSLREHRVMHLPRACALAHRLPCPSHAFDVVVASWVLEHLPAPAATFREIARVLRVGGLFFFLTPNVRHPLPRLSCAMAHLRRVQPWIVNFAYGRGAADTFPVIYEANSISIIERLATQAGLRLTRLDLIDDPTYFAWNRATFMMAVIAHALLPALWKVHLVGQVIKLGDKDI